MELVGVGRFHASNPWRLVFQPRAKTPSTLYLYTADGLETRGKKVEVEFKSFLKR
jgi:hypothetical protein